jgi:hypothetical protein
MNLDYLKNYCEDIIKQYPHLREDVIDLFQLAQDEIESGESQNNEVELAISSIKELIK